MFGTPRFRDFAVLLAALPIVAFASGALLPGCAVRSAQPSPVARPAAQASPRTAPESSAIPPSEAWMQDGAFADLPVPPSFQLEPDESFVFLQGSIRSADLNYVGEGAIADVIRFYQAEMPPLGWRFVRLTGVEMKTLSYSNGVEACEIILESHSGRPSAQHDGSDEVVNEEWHQGVSAGPARHPRPQTHLHIKLHER